MKPKPNVKRKVIKAWIHKKADQDNFLYFPAILNRKPQTLFWERESSYVPCEIVYYIPFTPNTKKQSR